MPSSKNAAQDEDQPEMTEIAVEAATRVMDAVEQDGLTLLMTELQGPMQERPAWLLLGSPVTS